MADRDLDIEVINAIGKTVVRPFFAVDLEFDSPNQLYFWSGIGDLTVGGITYTGAGDLLQVSDVRESSDISANGATLTMSGIPSTLTNLAETEPYQGRTCRIKFGLLDFELLEDSLLLYDDDNVLDISEYGTGGDVNDLDPVMMLRPSAENSYVRLYRDREVNGLLPVLGLGPDGGYIEDGLDHSQLVGLDLSTSQPASLFELFTGTMDQINSTDGEQTATISLSVESKLIDLQRARNRRYTDNNQQGRYSGDLAFEFVNRLQDEDIPYGS